MYGPNVVAIDGSSSVDEVAGIVLEACYEYGVDLYYLVRYTYLLYYSALFALINSVFTTYSASSHRRSRS